MGMGQDIDYSQFILQLEKAVAGGIPTLDSNTKIPKSQISLTASDVGAIATETDPTVQAFTKGLTSNNSILTALNAASGTISASVLPSYVDDFLTFSNLAAFPVTGETGKIYLAENTNLSYRWTGSSYVDISSAGTADQAVKLATPRTISATGDAGYSVSFDGSANVSSAIILATVNGNVGGFGSATQSPVITVDAKGRITAVSNSTITPAWSSIASKPTTLSGYGITDAQPLGNELTALQALADTAGFLKKTGNGSYLIDTASYLPLAGGTVTGVTTFSNTTPSTSPTTGANIVAGGQGIQGNQYIGGFSSLGGDANHPAIKIKVFEGTTAADEGEQSSLLHLVTSSKIISVSAIVEHSTGNFISSGNQFTPGYQFSISIGTSTIAIGNQFGNSGSILSKPFVITMFYKE